MTEHLGYNRHALEGGGSGNSGNGTYPKTVTTEIGKVSIDVPRDRNGTLDPVTVRKGQRRLDELNANVVSLYAKGMSTGDIQAHLAEIYGTDISRDTISWITDPIVEDMIAWQNRPLDRVFPVILIDAIVVKIRDGQVANRPVYVAMGINLDGQRDVLGMWVGPTGGEGAKLWMTVLTELRNRGNTTWSILNALVRCCASRTIGTGTSPMNTTPSSGGCVPSPRHSPSRRSRNANGSSNVSTINQVGSASARSIAAR